MVKYYCTIHWKGIYTVDSAIHLLNNYVINSLRAGYDTYNFVAIKMGSTVNSGALRTVQEHASGG